jgi:nitrate reductase NapD
VNLSGILIIVAPECIKSSVYALNALPGVEVYHIDESTGRIVVVQEAETIDAEVEGLKRIKQLPDIHLAEMVHHHFEDDKELLTDIPKDLDDSTGFDLAKVPKYLDD